ncbi:hypothetical protein S101395_00285 [Bacillus sonorensis]|uniref:Uncharacterized protein n=1 Tax=Bacillus sonorensis TaxID=119858 RepID=A0ABM6LC09_9BACI|nr:hypothetical protein S101395_00285 [Bacillus sonorensis]
MLKRNIISKISIGLLTSAALFSFILPSQEAHATFLEANRLFMSKPLTAIKNGQPLTLKSPTNRIFSSVPAMWNLTSRIASMRTQGIH